MNFVVALVSIALFVVSFRLAGIVPIASRAISRARQAMAVLTDRARTDDEKERAARDSSIALFGSFLTITGLTALALVPSTLCLLLAVWAGLADSPGLMSALISWPLIVAAILFFAIDYMIRR